MGDPNGVTIYLAREVWFGVRVQHEIPVCGECGRDVVIGPPLSCDDILIGRSQEGGLVIRLNGESLVTVTAMDRKIQDAARSARDG